MNENLITKIGWFASLMAMVMYFSYIDQIRLNLSGQTGSIILPIMTTVNCSAWSLYGLLKLKKDWPIVTCNLLGVVLGIVTAITAVIG